MGVVVADEFNAKRFERIYKVKPRVIPYGVDYEFWSHGYTTLDRRNFGFTVLQVGTITPYKNQVASIRAIEQLRKGVANMPIGLVLAGFKGDEKYFDELLSYIAIHGLTNIVEFTGHVDRKELRGLFHSCDVLLHPVKEQGGWLTPFDAMCAGLPVIVSGEFTGSDIIENNDLGVVTGDYADSIYDVYEKPERYKAWARKSGRWVKDNLSWEKFGEEMLDAYKKNTGK